MADIKLTGSEKQIKWAEDIMDSAYRTVEMNVEHINRDIAPTAPELAEKELEGWDAIREALDKAFATYTKAGDLINNRGSFDSERIIRQQSMIVNYKLS